MTQRLHNSRRTDRKRERKTSSIVACTEAALIFGQVIAVIIAAMGVVLMRGLRQRRFESGGLREQGHSAGGQHPITQVSAASTVSICLPR